MIEIQPDGSVTLTLTDTLFRAANWEAIPDGLVELVPADDGRSCLAIPIAGKTGRCTVRASDSQRVAFGYFSLEVRAPPRVKVAGVVDADPAPGGEASAAS